MKRFTPLLLPMILVMASCGNDPKPSILNSTNLKSSFITLDGDSAYSLKTPKGAILKIAKNTFAISTGQKLRLEIKEAYSIQDILLAGLTTKSNGKLLTSGGMIYIKATASDREIKLLKPIHVSIPTDNYDSRMQLFNGEIKDDSSINWINPQPLDSSPITKRLFHGEQMFKANCASCHKPNRDFTGPGLAGCRTREPNPEWAYSFTNNSNIMVETDPYAREQMRRYGTKMTQFNLAKEDVRDILDFCDDFALRYPELAPRTDSTSRTTANIVPVAPCPVVMDTVYYPVPDTNFQFMPQDTTSAIEMNIIEKQAYQFNIDQNGWYNVDCFADLNAGAVTNVTLFANLKLPKELRMETYLCVPSRKLLQSGNERKDKSYDFYYGNEILPLILNDEAFIIAVGADSSRMYYGITKFNVKMQQTIMVTVKESSKENFLQAIKNNKLDSVKIDIAKPETYPFEMKLDSTRAGEKGAPMQMQIIERPCGDFVKVDSLPYSFIVIPGKTRGLSNE